MSSKEKVTSTSTCCVCYKDAEYYSIGMCEHAVCYECSTRMRVLCQQNECPICRQDLPKVVFTKEIKPFRFLRKGNLMDAKYNIYFDSHEVQQKFFNLLAHRCSVCKDGYVYNSFHALTEHMRRKHDLYYCDFCVDNIKIFPHERRAYTKPELSRHRRKGDPDDTSHRGHPLCEFCEHRYMDNDELYRHLRRDHLFCHFCDADGLHHYYCSYADLRDHFRKEHYLCEEGSCLDEQFTSVFRTDIDLKAHKATVHGKQLGKHAAKQARTLELEFTLAPRGDLRNRRGPLSQNRNYNNHDGNANSHPRNVPEEPEPIREEQPTFVRQPLCDVQSTEEFPTLGNATPSLVPHISHSKGRHNFTIRSTLRKGNYDDNFPALGPETPGTSVPTTTKTLNFSVSANKGPTATTSGRQQSVGAPNLSIHVNTGPNGTVMTRLTGPNLRIQPSTSRDLDFPALNHSIESATSSTLPSSQNWTKVTCVKAADLPINKKIAPPPLASSPPTIRSGEDFPSLSKSKSKGQSQISSSSWVQVQSTNTSNGGVSDATKGKAKKKKIKPQNSVCDNTGGQSYSVKVSMESKKTVPDSNKKDNKGKKNLDSTTNSTSDEGSLEKRSFVPATPASAMRKRSEIKIDNLNTTNNNISHEAKTAKTQSQKVEDFPALGRRPPGLNSPPPGFTAPVMSTASTNQPPPGFNKPNGLTFTNSSGESYTIVPEKQSQHCYSYLLPPDFSRRNKNLIAEFNDWFKSEESDELKTFKYISGLFRNGVCDAEEYYKQCQTVMGAEVFKRVFPELLALLPDIRKQRELFEVHKREIKSSGRVRGLESCANCGQILRSADLQQHASSHTLENHFPALGSTSNGPNAWTKK